MFQACQKSKVTIKLKFYYSNLKNAVETVKIAVDSCYVLRQFLTQLLSIDFREIRRLLQLQLQDSLFLLTWPEITDIIYSIFFVVSSRWNMASTVNSELYNTTLLIAKFENKVGRLQLASFAGYKTTLHWCI
jgi:hypothetical protein